MKNKYQYEEGIKVYYYIPNDIGVDEELPILFIFLGKPRNSASILADMIETAGIHIDGVILDYEIVLKTY